jgi:DNA-binding GntR family transcriptional regulator
MLSRKESIHLMSTRKPLRDEVHQLILDRLLRGELPPGGRVIESELATRLGVSRTPLREALFRLEQEGFLQADLARGFTVVPLTAREVREIYPIIWTLECLALTSIGLPERVSLSELKQINDDLAQVRDDPAHMLTLDSRWHETLVQSTPNHRLLRMIASLKKVAYRYEWAYMRETTLVATSVEQHSAIIDALCKQDLAQAITLLEDNWRFGMNALLQHLDWL